MRLHHWPLQHWRKWRRSETGGLTFNENGNAFADELTFFYNDFSSVISRWTFTKCTLVTWMMSRLYWFLCISAHFQVKKTLYQINWSTSYFNFQCLFRFWEKTNHVGSVLGPHNLRNAYDSYLYLPSLGRQVNFLRKKIKTRSKKWLYFFRYIWLGESYILFGGYSLLNIAMYGYIGMEALKWIFQTQNLNYFSPKKKQPEVLGYETGWVVTWTWSPGDVSSAKERTTLIAVLGALGFIM